MAFRLYRLFLLGAALSVAAPHAIAAQADTTSSDVPLEVLAERVTRAVVLIDVQTATGSRQGSGFVIGPDGLILTNDHVVRNATTARVKLASGDVYDRVSVLARDARRDIAVLRIDGFSLPTLSMGNSDSVRVGAPIVVVGSPLGLENTVSTGIVSGRRQEPEGFQLLQITAPASRGSSGGAVLSARGDVIAIATSQLLSGQNLNFAVPINYARGMLQNLDEREAVVLAPMSDSAEQAPAEPMAADNSVNRGLTFELDVVGGYVVETSATLGEDLVRRTRTTYRRIETVGGDVPRIERYYESETTRSTEPFGTRETVRRERVRSLVDARDLSPLSSRGEISWWADDGWRHADHDVRFEGERVLGILTDTTGRSLELDRTLPPGILLRNTRDLAFATLQVDSLLGRSVEFATLDPWTGELATDRYDVLAVDTTEVAGPPRPALRVNVAAGLLNEVILFQLGRPRIPLSRYTQEGVKIEEVTRVEVFPSGVIPRF